ncbi:MAG: hypothetical protein QW290_09295 [Sulfolobales archaeon]
MSKRRYRIHPAVAVTAIICLTAMAITAQLHSGADSSLKVLIASIIGLIVGVKVRVKLPLT